MSRDYDEPCEDCGRPTPFGGQCRPCRNAARFQALMDAHEDPPPPEDDECNDDCEPPGDDE